LSNVGVVSLATEFERGIDCELLGEKRSIFGMRAADRRRSELEREGRVDWLEEDRDGIEREEADEFLKKKEANFEVVFIVLVSDLILEFIVEFTFFLAFLFLLPLAILVFAPRFAPL
jgi:hypothetical protein